jgi:CheY-like chemotaxis protein
MIVQSLNSVYKTQSGKLLNFDCILMDFVMPNMDGSQCAERYVHIYIYIYRFIVRQEHNIYMQILL